MHDSAYAPGQLSQDQKTSSLMKILNKSLIIIILKKVTKKFDKFKH